MILQADAFALPFKSESFDVIVADPPYSGKNRGKKGLGYRQLGYVPFQGRAWWREAWRTLAPSGHLYIFCAIRELAAWFAEVDGEVIFRDVVAWIAPNNPAIMAFWQRGVGSRAPAWRPILHWQKQPGERLDWFGVEPQNNPLWGRPMRLGRRGVYVDPNVYLTAAIQSQMAESFRWPNQLPVKLLTWLLRPHQKARVLDLFSGTGTTREAAVELGLGVVSVELSPQGLHIIRQRPAQRRLPI